MQTTLDPFQTAVEHHQGGRLDQAEQIYAQILRVNPGHADALHLLGVIAHQRGRHGRAIDAIARALKIHNAAPYHVNLAEAYRANGDPVRAEEHCREALSLGPHNPEALHNLGLTLLQLGRDDEAVGFLEAAVERQPFWPLPFVSLGMLHRRAGRLYDAVAVYREGVRLCPEAARLRNDLGATLLELGLPEEALSHCREAVRLRPDQPEALTNLGNVLARLGQVEEAGVRYEQAIRLDPNAARPYARLGALARSQGQFDVALNALEQAARLDPNDAEIRAEAAGVLYALERPDDAVAAYREAIRLRPTEPVFWNGLGYVLQDMGRMSEALAAYREAVRLRSDYADAHLNMGILLTETGEKQKGVEAYREALRHNPEHPEALAGLGVSLRDQITPEEEASAERVIAKRGIPERRRAVLLYGMTQVKDARGEYDRAAALAREANACYEAEARVTGRAYSTREHREYVDQIIRTYSPEHFERVRGWGSDTANGSRPIFVLGLPRSGTSLIEQILASHPDVYGAGELNLMQDIYRSLPGITGKHVPGVECVPELNRETVRALAGRYLEGLSRINANTRFVVDKLPDNYLMLGLIATLFPNARIIHTRRDVRDVGLSCWLTHFKHIRWACNLEHIGHRIREYQRLLDHWRAVLPGRVLEVEYEAVVEDLEGHARPLVEACGLTWDPACLKFHEQKRVVRTASMVQVLEPIYRSSVGRWRHYGSHLKPLLELLEAGPEPAHGPA